MLIEASQPLTCVNGERWGFRRNGGIVRDTPIRIYMCGSHFIYIISVSVINGGMKSLIAHGRFLIRKESLWFIPRQESLNFNWMMLSPWTNLEVVLFHFVSSHLLFVFGVLLLMTSLLKWLDEFWSSNVCCWEELNHHSREWSEVDSLNCILTSSRMEDWFQLVGKMTQNFAVSHYRVFIRNRVVLPLNITGFVSGMQKQRDGVKDFHLAGLYWIICAFLFVYLFSIISLNQFYLQET